MINKIKLWWFKRKLRAAYLDWIGDYADCGITMADYLNGKRSRVNELIDKVNELDPTANLKHK